MSFIAQITADISNFENNIKKAVDTTNSSAQKMQASFDRLGESFVKIGAKASILSAGIVAIGTKAFLMAADIEDAVGATEQIFKENADSVNAWASKLDTSFGIAKKEALEYSNLMGSMLINIGKLTEQEASKQSAKLIELAGDLTAMYGGSTQDAVRALTGALKGNNTMLDNYGMAVNEALIKTKALELGLVGANGEMTLQAKQGATLALIWEQTGAAQGQAAREADGASGAMRALKTEITNLSTELGDVLLPVITPIVSGIRDFVSGIRDLSPEAKKMIVVVAGIAAAIGPVLLGLGGIIKILPLVMAGFTAITGPVGIAMTAIAGATILVVKNWDSIHRYFTSGAGADTFDAIIRDVIKFKQDISTIFIEIKRTLESIWSGMGKALGNETESFLEVINRGFQNTLNLWRNLWIDFKKARASESLTEEFTNIGKMFSNFGKGLVADVVEPVDKVGVVVKELTQAQQDAMTAGNKWGLSLEKVAEDASKVNPEVEALNKEIERLKALLNPTKALDILGGKSLIPEGSLKELSEKLKVLYEQLDNATTTSARVSVATLIKEIEAKKATLELELKVGMTSPIQSDIAKVATGATVVASDVWNVDNKELSEQMSVTAQTVHDNIAEMNEDAYDSMVDFSGLIAGTMTNFAGIIGDAFGGDFSDFGANLLGAVGNFAQQFGGLVIAAAITAESLKKLITNPFLAAAAGAALVTLGAVVSKKAQSMTSNLTGGGYSSAPSMQSTGVSQSMPTGEFRDSYSSGQVEFTISGDNLVGVLNKKETRRNRNL